MKTMWMVGLAVGFATVATAQEVILRPYEFNQQSVAFVSGQLLSGPPVKGAPYSGEAVNETIQTLADGNRIVQRTSAMQYRDTDGRERREETSAMGVIFITDPVAGTRYTLHPDSRTAERATIVPKLFAAKVRDNTAFGILAAALAGARFAAGSNDSKIEQLGSRFIEGVQAQGTRTTTTIPAGDIGNERPMNIIDEQWYSSDLRMTVMTKHSDPRSGDTTFQLKNINRSDPPPNLFEIPPDYTVKTPPAGMIIKKRE
ncbi:MAG: hypothetical protein ACRD4E_04605 [Bryobacteraceae bacterium]